MSISIDVVNLTMSKVTDTPEGEFTMTIPFDDIEIRDIKEMDSRQALVLINYIEIFSGNERG